ncbi:hypothetical protein ACOMHN_057911 [Nucella lapillus]
MPSLMFPVASDGSPSQEALDDLHYDVVAVICCATDQETKDVGRVLGVAQIPQANFAAKEFVKGLRSARVVVLIAYEEEALTFLSAVQDICQERYLLWIGTDAWAHVVTRRNELAPFLAGSLIVNFEEKDVPEFNSWFKQLTPNTTSNIWFTENWEHFFNCSFREGTCSPDLTLTDARLPEDEGAGRRGYVVDAVYMIANATSRVLQSPDCQKLTGYAAARCVTGPRLLKELKATSQPGFSGWLELDANGDRRVSYSVKQLQKVGVLVYKTVFIAEYDFTTNKSTYLNAGTYINNISWDYHNIQCSDRLRSTCSHPCKPFEARNVRGQPCCWTCQLCHENEYVADNGTICKRCPEFLWPEPLTRQSCVKITPKSALGPVRRNNLQNPDVGGPDVQPPLARQVV